MADREKDTNDRLDDRRNDELYRELDAALAKYSSVEPRAGLEERVLANLRAQPSRASDHAWWRWPVVAALAVAVIVVVALASRPVQPRPETANHTPSAPARNKPLEKHVASNRRNDEIRPQASIPARRVYGPVHPVPVTAEAAYPKLEQFPSPQPLSEQEKLLASYVAQYPEHAELVAEARMEVLRRNREEELREASTENSRDVQPQ